MKRRQRWLGRAMGLGAPVGLVGLVALGAGCGGRTLGGFIEDSNNTNGTTNDNGVTNSNVNTNVNVNANTNTNTNTGPGDWPADSGPPIDDLGGAGWRGSTEPWDPVDHDYQTALEVWSRPEAVYVVAAGMPAEGGPYGPGDNPETWRISRNDGAGWQVHYEWGDMGFGMESTFTGFPDGRLLLTMVSDWGMPELWEISPDGATAAGLGFDAHHVFIVGNDLGYAATDNERKVVRLQGTQWGPLPVDSPYDVYRLWADADTLFGVGSFGTVVSLGDNGWRVHDPGSLSTFTAVWGFGPDDVWIGADGGALEHWDGHGWTDVSWPGRTPFPDGYVQIEGMWGADGVLFLRTFFQLVRCESATLQCQELAYWPCTPDVSPDGSINYCTDGVAIHSMWGNSPQEVFLAVNVSHEDAGDGTNPFLLWYDGSLFHWF